MTSLIDPVRNTYTLKVTTLKRWLMWTFLHQNFPSIIRFPQGHVNIMPGFTAGNEKVS
ncbi:hypothetical protein O9993_07980 [Vibrio lentus]|nr:hypothetical protein [Vibrio lentus]